MKGNFFINSYFAMTNAITINFLTHNVRIQSKTTSVNSTTASLHLQ